MSNSTASDTLPNMLPEPSFFGSSVFMQISRIAWRNLWRNRRRTWLTLSGIAFAVWFLIFGRSMQGGTFDLMIDNGARMFTGHIQIQHPDYQDDPRVEHVFDSAAALAEATRIPAIRYVSARAAGFALVANEERSFGAQILGIDAAIEGQWTTLATTNVTGRYIEGRGEAFIGAALARNLSLTVGDELVVLGTAKQGGIAALATRVVGIFDTGQPALDRALVKVHIDDFREAWALGANEAHMLVLLSDSPTVSEGAAVRLRRELPSLAVLGWSDLMPEAEQMRDMKMVSTELFFYVIVIIVGFSVINTFMMLVFERTSELGVLKAIGMRPGLLRLQLQLEALYLSLIGIGVGLLIAVILISVFSQTGIPLPVEDMDEIYKKFNMPSKLYPAFDWVAFHTAAIVVLIGVQFAAFVPGLRIGRLHPVEAIRQEG